MSTIDWEQREFVRNFFGVDPRPVSGSRYLVTYLGIGSAGSEGAGTVDSAVAYRSHACRFAADPRAIHNLDHASNPFQTSRSARSGRRGRHRDDPKGDNRTIRDLGEGSARLRYSDLREISRAGLLRSTTREEAF